MAWIKKIMADQRNNDLARIHIAKKDLHLDDDTYRQIIRNIGGAESGSASDLSFQGRVKVIQHFTSQGWKPKSGRSRNAVKSPGMASNGQIRYIRYIWIRLADNDVVKRREEAGLRAWIQSATSHIDPQKVGYAAPEFLPKQVAAEVIEQLKKWAKRTDTRI